MFADGLYNLINSGDLPVGDEEFVQRGEFLRKGGLRGISPERNQDPASWIKAYLNVGLIQREVKDVGIVRNPLLLGRLGNDHKALRREGA